MTEDGLKILDVTPMLTVAAMEPAIAFSREIPGFECEAATDGWACCDSGRLAIDITHLRRL